MSHEDVGRNEVLEERLDFNEEVEQDCSDTEMSSRHREHVKHVVQCCIEMWLTHHNVPEIVMMHQGGEFESTFGHESEEFLIDVHITGSHAG